MNTDEIKLKIYRPPAKERQQARCEIEDGMEDYYYQLEKSEDEDAPERDC